MKIRESDLRYLIRETANDILFRIQEDLKNVGGRHERTAAGSIVLRKMHDAPGVMEALTKIKDPKELAHIIEAIIDAVPIVRRDEVLQSLTKVTRHERSTHKR